MAVIGDSAEPLCGEILDEGRREAARITGQARQEAEGLLEAAAAESRRIGEEELDRARNDARRRKESILSTVPVETGRMRAARVESLLDGVREEARRRLLAREGFDYYDAVVELTALAIEQMAGISFVARFAGTDRALLRNGFREDVAHRVGRSSLTVAPAFDAEGAKGGVIVEGTGGREMCDNGLTARLERMWPELRRQIAQRASFVPMREPGGTLP